MRSVRLDPESDSRLRRAAELEGISVSEFLRRAAAERAERTLSSCATDRLADILGTVHGRREQARQTGAAFTDVLAENHRARK